MSENTNPNAEHAIAERFIETVQRTPQTVEYEQIPSKINILGICGREGAGKTTIANLLTGNTGPLFELREVEPIGYICDVLFGEDDQIWKLKRFEQKMVVSCMLRIHVDSKWEENHKICLAPFDIMPDTSSNWTEFSLATSLKKVCSVIFDTPYDVLLAQTPEARIARETVKCGETFDRLPYNMNGRICLEYFGTDVMRNHFDKDIWIKILRREVSSAIAAGQRVAIPDIRFANELELINGLDGTLMTVYRNDTELILTDTDRNTHPAKWNFLEFYMLAHRKLIYQNNRTMDMLKTDIVQMLG